MAYRAFSSKKRTVSGLGYGGSGPAAPVPTAANTIDARAQGAKTPCIPDAVYPFYWNDPREIWTDDAGNKLSGIGIQYNDLAWLCNRTTELLAAAKASPSIYPNIKIRQDAIDAAWQEFLSGAATVPVVGNKYVKFTKLCDKKYEPYAPIPQFACASPRYQYPQIGGNIQQPYAFSKNFPDPCAAYSPSTNRPMALFAPCSVVSRYENSDTKSGQSNVVRVEREPYPPEDPYREKYHPVDSQVADPARLRLTEAGDSMPDADMSVQTFQITDVPYLKRLKESRDNQRVITPIGSVTTQYSFKLPAEATTRSSMMIAGTVVTAVALGALVHVLTRKK